MKPLKKSTLLLASAALSLAATTQATEVNTDPVGYVTWDIAAGNGASRALTPLALPLVDPASGLDGATAGTITSLTSTTLSDSNAGWTVGELSNDVAPICIRITSGTAEGRTFLISTTTDNTANTVTIDAQDLTGVDLTSVGISTGDAYELLNCDTFATLLGSPETTGIVGAASAADADQVLAFVSGAWATFYYDTDAAGGARWTQLTGGFPDASNQPIRPDSALLFSRKDTNALSVTLTGRVPTTDRLATVNAGGVTPLGSSWPVDIRLDESNIEAIGEWASNTDASLADLVFLFDGVWRSFYHDGTNWKEVTGGFPVSDSQIIESGSIVLISKRQAASGAQVLDQSIPYSL